MFLRKIILSQFKRWCYYFCHFAGWRKGVCQNWGRLTHHLLMTVFSGYLFISRKNYQDDDLQITCINVSMGDKSALTSICKARYFSWYTLIFVKLRVQGFEKKVMREWFKTMAQVTTRMSKLLSESEIL